MLATLNMIYFSLVSILVMFGAIVFYLSTSGSITPDPEFAQVLRYVLIMVLPIGLGAGYFIFKKQMEAIDSTLTLHEKLMKYQTAVLVRSGCFEMPGLLAAVAALITGDISLLLFTAIVVVIFLMVRPSVYTITTDLNLSQTERSMLENPSSSN